MWLVSANEMGWNEETVPSGHRPVRECQSVCVCLSVSPLPVIERLQTCVPDGIAMR